MEPIHQIELFEDTAMDEECLGGFLTDPTWMETACDLSSSLAEFDDINWVDTMPQDDKDTRTTENESEASQFDERPQTPPPPSLFHEEEESTTELDVFFSPVASDESLSSSACTDEYQKAIEQLRASMKRSEVTRRQIICNQLFLQQPAPSPELLPHSLEFFNGSRSTLTVGLEQSRSLLMTYMEQTNTL